MFFMQFSKNETSWKNGLLTLFEKLHSISKIKIWYISYNMHKGTVYITKLVYVDKIKLQV